MPCQPVCRLSPSLPFEQPFLLSLSLSRLLELIAKLEPFTPNSQLLASPVLLSRGDNDIFGADRDQARPSLDPRPFSTWWNYPCDDLGLFPFIL